MSVQDKFHDQKIIHPVAAGYDLNAAQHLRSQFDQRRISLEIRRIKGTQISVEHVDHPRNQLLDLAFMFGPDLKLGPKPQVLA